MDALNQYRQHIQNLLKEQASHAWYNRIQAQTNFDTERDTTIN